MFKKRVAKRSLIIIVGCLVIVGLCDLIFPLKVNVTYSPVVLARDGTVMHTFLTKDEQWRMFTELEEISPELKKAIIFKEDKYFHYHFGINPIAVCRAAANNFFYAKRTSGASTITMQVARMLEPKRRTYLNKITEAFRALQLEIHYSKNEILQLYLNLVPYGSNIQGVKAASILYFNKTPDQLSLAEITALSIIPNRPNSLVIGKHNDRITDERNKWLNRFGAAKLFTPSVISDALQEPLIAYRHEAPKQIPHLAYRLKRQYAGLYKIKTTIDPHRQIIAEQVIQTYVNSLKQFNIHNAAVLVLDNKTREVLCYIGSSDPFDYQHNGAVDGIFARRSPGSTLKPLLYALCIDRGFITPKMMIADVPVDFGGYMPENFDLGFRGNVSVEQALQQSLNIPAVKLLDKTGVPSFTATLVSGGFNSIWRQRKQLGLSMILGGCTVRLEELTSMYATLPNEGRYASPVFIKNDKIKYRQKLTQIFSPASSYLVSKMITGLYRPDLPNLHDKSLNLPNICWKTGTSYGRKDAWSIGYNNRYTIGVWIGNFNGKGVPELNGAAIATPVLFNLFRGIDKKCGEEWLNPPHSVSFRLVCSETGLVPNEFCEDLINDYYIPGISTNQVCDHIRSVWLAADEKISYCTSCLPQNGYKTKAFKNVTAELASFYEMNHISYEKLPPHNPECNRSFEGKAPVINSLTNDMTYLITDKGKQKLQLNCKVSNDVQKVYWYINDQFLTDVKAGEKVFFIPDVPEIKISCADDKGRVSNIHIQIRFI